MIPPRQERHRRSPCCDVSEFGRIINNNMDKPGLGSSTVDQVLKYTKYIPSTSTGQVLIFLKST